MSVLTTAATGIGISYSITCVLERYNIPYATADYQARGRGFTAWKRWWTAALSLLNIDASEQTF